MATKFIGYRVTVRCGDVLGDYEGKLNEVDVNGQTLTLTNVQRNGISCAIPKVTLRAEDIKEIQIISCKLNENENNHRSSASNDTFESPVKQDDNRKKLAHNSLDCRRKVTTTPKKNENRRRFSERDDAAFNEPVSDYILENEFDFEKNLALFDKKAVKEELSARSRPDVVRLTDCNRRNQQVKYRNDENILEQEPAVYRQVQVPCVVEKEFVTDSGLVVPSITRELRDIILSNIEKIGFSLDRRIEVIGRAASEMILHLIGGSHRINPQNTHQKPTVVVICGNHVQGAQGVSCARQLTNHGVEVHLMKMAVAPRVTDRYFGQELILFEYTDGKIISKIEDLPSKVDIIVGALESTEDIRLDDIESLYFKAIIQWVNHCRAPVLCLDPPPSGASLFNPKWVLSPLLPFAFSGVNLHLCDLGIPSKVYSMSNVKYVSVFGSKFVIPLYENNVSR